jgi:hypothetical protein
MHAPTPPPPKLRKQQLRHPGNTATGVITGTSRIRGNPATGEMLRRVLSQTIFHSSRTTRANYMPASASVVRITTQNWPGVKGTNLRGVTGWKKLNAGQAGAKTPQDPAGQTQHVQHYVTRKSTREGTRKVQVEELPPPNQIIHTAVASPHKVAQGKRQKLMDPALWMRFHPFVATLERWASGVSATCGEPWTRHSLHAQYACWYLDCWWGIGLAVRVELYFILSYKDQSKFLLIPFKGCTNILIQRVGSCLLWYHLAVVQHNYPLPR